MPDYNRRQRPGTCKTCHGDTRFYPQPLENDAAMVAEQDTAGEWVHLDPSDWRDNPHPVDPQEATADADHDAAH